MPKAKARAKAPARKTTTGKSSTSTTPLGRTGLDRDVMDTKKGSAPSGSEDNRIKTMGGGRMTDRGVKK